MADLPVRSLVRPDAVHRAVYADPDVFRLEQERLFGRTWLYAGHESEVREPGSYVARTLSSRPIIISRDHAGAIRAFFNRCPHKGARLVENGRGSVRQFRCPYHAWSFDLAGNRLSVPMRDGYEDTGFEACEWAAHLAGVPRLHDYRGFLFIAFSDNVAPFTEHAAGILHVFDDMVDRSPVDRLSIVSRPYRIRMRANWKLYIENLQDTVHPHAAHESAVDAALQTLEGRNEPVPFRVMLSSNLDQPFAFWEQLEQIATTEGHTTMGGIVGASHDAPPDSLLRDALIEAKGKKEASRILSVGRHNTIFYPNLAIQSTYQQLRVLHPVAVDETIIEVYHLRIEGVPDAYYRERTLAYTNTVNAPSTPISADDLELFARVQRGLRAEAPDWISLHRDFGRDSQVNGTMTGVGTSELPQRAQMQAWSRLVGAEA